MVDLYELKQLTAFADLGTLHRVAEEFHLSTPSITRSMQHLEQYFGVPLFTRGKNRIELNDYLMEKYDTSWDQDTARPFIMENDSLMEGYRTVPTAAD